MSFSSTSELLRQRRRLADSHTSTPQRFVVTIVGMYFFQHSLISFFFQALLDLEHSASSDEAVRERIASLPPEVSEISLLTKLQGKMLPSFRLMTALRLIMELKQEYNWFIDNGFTPPGAGPCTCPPRDRPQGPPPDPDSGAGPSNSGKSNL